MTEVLVYDKLYTPDRSVIERRCWHSNHRVFADLVPGDRLWIVTSGRSLGREDQAAGYLVAVWPVAAVIANPDDDPQYPARKFQHRVLVNQTEVLQLDDPVCIDHVIRPEGYHPETPVGRFLRGPRRLSDEKLRLLRSAAGPELATKWLTGNRQPAEQRHAAGSGPTKEEPRR